MSEVEGKRLNSWKQIARYLGRDVRTVMRWEKQGAMPVHRIPGPGDGRSVFAYTAELDAWLSGDGPRGGGASGRRRVLAGMAVAVVLAVVVGGVLLTVGERPSTVPARVVAEGEVVTARSVLGETLWTLRHPEGRLFRESEQVVRILEAGDGAGRQILLAANTFGGEAGEAPTGELLSLSNSGELLWRWRLEEEIRFGERLFSGPWISTFLHTARADGEELILWAVHHSVWWPSVLLVLTPEGVERGRFTNSGWISSAAVLRSDGVDRVLVAGVSNAHQAAMLAVLPGADFSGTSPEESGSPFACQDCASALPLEYMLFPPTHVNRAGGLPYNNALVGLSDDGVVVTVLEGPQGSDAQWVYELDRRLDIRHAAPGDSYWTRHRLLEGEGKLDHHADECPERDGLVVQRWTRNRGWTSTPPQAPGRVMR